MRDRFAIHFPLPRADVREEVMSATVQALKAHRRRLLKLRIAAADCQAIGKGLEKVYRACRRRMKRAFAAGDDDTFHRWRIRLKNLYYDLQFLQPIWPTRLHSMAAQLKKIQEKVGDDHDLAVLKAALQRTPEHFGGGSLVKRVLHQLNERSQKLRAACRPLAEEALNERPHAFALKLHRRLAAW